MANCACTMEIISSITYTHDSVSMRLQHAFLIQNILNVESDRISEMINNKKEDTHFR